MPFVASPKLHPSPQRPAQRLGTDVFRLKRVALKWCARTLVALPFVWLLLRAGLAFALPNAFEGMYTSSIAQHRAYWGESAPESRPWAGWLWQRVRYANLSGKQQWLFSSHVGRQRPAVGDLDGDGDLDLLLGVESGQVLVFFNTSAKGQPPKWRNTNDSLLVGLGTDQSPQPLQVSAMAAPALGDLDKDGDLDLLVGTRSGALLFFENVGNRLVPEFVLRSRRFAGIVLSSAVSPALADVNRDGLLDLALGLEDGAVWVLHNVGMPGQPRFCPLPDPNQPSNTPRAFCAQPAERITQNAPHAAPAWVDWDGDGDLDLLIGNQQGQLLHWRNIGSSQRGVWEETYDGFRLLRSAGMAAPAFADFNTDGKPDLLLGSASEYLAFYQSKNGTTQHTARAQAAQGNRRGLLSLRKTSHNVLNLVRLGRSGDMLHFSAADLNGDGLLDLVMGSQSGALRVLYNQSNPTNLALSTPASIVSLAQANRRNVHPALGDLDGDGDADLLLGGQNGALEWIENVGDRKLARWRVRTANFAQVRTHGSSVPTLHDIDADGHLDVILSDTQGSPVVIRNLRANGFALDSTLQSLLTIHLQQALPKPNPTQLLGAIPVVFPVVLAGVAKQANIRATGVSTTKNPLHQPWLMWMKPNGVIEAGSPVVRVPISALGVSHKHGAVGSVRNPLFYAPKGSKALIVQLRPKQGPWLLVSTPQGGLLCWQAKLPLEQASNLLALSNLH